MTDGAQQLLPGSIEMPFAEIAAALATGRDPSVRLTPPRTLTGTVVAVCSAERLGHAAEALQRLGRRAAVRSILISEGSETKPKAFVAEDAVAVPGLKAPFVNNAVAALRLSSLPTLVWWCDCSAGMLDDLADLADRMVLDDHGPFKVWKRAAELFEETAFSDLRWTRLTRWRSLMAHFFDIPEVRAASARLDQLRIKGSDPVAASLYAAWLAASLGREGSIDFKFENSQRGVFVEEIRFAGSQHELKLQLADSGRCVLTSSTMRGHGGVMQTVALGDQREPALLTQELRIRVRDLPFERALRACLATAP